MDVPIFRKDAKPPEFPKGIQCPACATKEEPGANLRRHCHPRCNWYRCEKCQIIHVLGEGGPDRWPILRSVPYNPPKTPAK